MDPLIIFDDNHGELGPMTDLRGAFEIRTGVFTTAGRLLRHWPDARVTYWTDPTKRDLVAERSNAPVNRMPDAKQVLCVNGRLALPGVVPKLKVNHAIIESESGDVIAAYLPAEHAKSFLETHTLHDRVITTSHDDRVLFRYPWDVIAWMKRTIAHDIKNSRIVDAEVIPQCATCIGDHPVEIHDTARIMPNVVLDATNGPIDVYEHVTIRPNAVITGPCAIGPHCTIIDHALIKANTVLGPWCKVGGEIGATIIQGYSNKSHDGHLGDSWLGKWVNFGAGTTNSNLLNTYGEVAMRNEPDGPRRRTGLTFLGAIVGDHVKTAIGTRLMTGTCIGTGAMIASTAPPPVTVNRFAWLTDDGERVFRWNKFTETMRAMMARRDTSPSDEYMSVLKNLYSQHTNQ